MEYYLCPCYVDKNSLYYLKRNAIFKAAPEPEDIIFENLEITTFSRNIRTFIIHIISIFIVCFNLGINVALDRIQVLLDKKNEDNLVFYLYLISFLKLIILKNN